MPETQPNDQTCPEETLTNIPENEQKPGIDETAPSNPPPMPNNRRNTGWRMKGHHRR